MFARFGLLLSFVAWIASPVSAQQHRSILRVVLMDAQGRPAAGVGMRLINEATGETRRVESDASGRLTALQLEPGNYRLEGAGDPHASFVARVAVAIHDDRTIVLPLGAASIAEAVDYRPFMLDIDRNSPALRTRLTGTFVADLPLDGRTLSDAALLTPRVGGSEAGPVALGSHFSAHLLDGFHNSDALFGMPAVRTQLDAVQELEVATPHFDASFGRSAGAQVNVVTRSGTNTLRGGAFGFAQTELNRRQLGAFGGGPLARDRSFLFADLHHTRFSDSVPGRRNGNDAGARLDHLFGSARLTGRYALSDGTTFERRGQQAGASLAHVMAGRANDVRVGMTDVDFGEFGPGGPRGNRTYQVADTFSWAAGPHAWSVGADWQGFDVAEREDAVDVQNWGGFVQNHWRASRALSISAGARVDRLQYADDRRPSETRVAPRAGFVWIVGEEGRAAIRGGYGRYHNLNALPEAVDALDHWHVGAARPWGRTRTIEAGYQGTTGGGRAFRYHALVFEMEQRSEIGLTGHLGYTYSRWSDTPETAVASADRPGHKLTGAFTTWLPVGDGRELLSRGLVGDVLANLQMAGVFAIQSAGITDPFGTGANGYRTLDLAIMKNVPFGRERNLQLRFETFNTFNRPNVNRALFRPDLLDAVSPDNSGRRYQFGARMFF